MRLVSSQATIGTAFKVSVARADRSAKFPIGVATMYNRPAMCAPWHVNRQADVYWIWLQCSARHWRTRIRRRTGAALVGAILLAACETAPPAPPVAPPAPVEDPVQATIRQGESAATGAESARLFLTALTTLYERGDHDDAARVVARVAPLVGNLRPAEQFRYREIALELALLAQTDKPGERPRLAELLSRLNPGTPRQALVAARFKARLLGFDPDMPKAAALAWIEVAEHPAAADRDVQAASAEAWRHLRQLSAFEAERLARAAPTAVGRAWAILARNHGRAMTERLQFQAWQAWRAANAGHPAARHPPSALQRKPGKPGQLALLIPLNGPLGGTGRAVLDGFSAALLHAEGADAQTPRTATTVRLYDTSASTAAQAYRQAVSEGADLVIGPLRKAAVADVAALALQTPAVPVLALNQIDGPPRTPAIPQLALAPEDDATAIASALRSGGAARVILLDNAESWSQRATARFLDERGSVAVVATGKLSSIVDVTRVVGEALGASASTARHAEIQRLLGVEIEFTPRRRDDVDAVVAFVSPQQLLALKPALEFHFAADLAVYAPSAAVGSGYARLDGVRICGMPWQLHGSPLRTATAALEASRGPSAAWFAFGIDGFRLASQWQRLNAGEAPIAGSTGMLRMAPDGRIERQLAWAVVKNGRLIPTLPNGD